MFLADPRAPNLRPSTAESPAAKSRSAIFPPWPSRAYAVQRPRMRSSPSAFPTYLLSACANAVDSSRKEGETRPAYDKRVERSRVVGT